MKHVFVINPAAGKENAYDAIRVSLERLHGVDYELYQTTGQGDATAFVRDYCEKYREPIRFYACGGDGTLNEVVNGVATYPHASLGCYPSGSGNDFVKYYGGKEAFLDVEALINAPEELIDLIRVGDRYAINAAHFGFDSCVAKTMTAVRRKKIIGGKRAYTTGVIVGLIKAMRNKCKVTADGELLNPKGTILLCTVVNGQYVGGSFRCAPRSLDNDGALEVCLVRPISHITFLKLMGAYEKGTHLDDKRFEKYIEYRRAKRVTVEAHDHFVYSMDGELYTHGHFDIEVCPQALRFAVPTAAKPLAGELHVPQRESKEELLTV